METVLAITSLYITTGMVLACYIDWLFNKSNKAGLHNIHNNGEPYKLTYQEVVMTILLFPIVIALLIKC